MSRSLRAHVVLGGRFEVERPVGGGGMGEIYEGRDWHRGGERVAIKVTQEADLDDQDRFSREAQLLQALNHEAIVRHIAHGTTDYGLPYLVMGWLDGHDLATRLEAGPLDLVDTLALGRRIASALGAAHRAEVVHRDVKPSNVFLPGGRASEATLIDFGLARPPVGNSRKLTRTGFMVGSPGYMSPELARGERELLPASDVFSLGCVLFECVAGRPAFLAEQVLSLLAKILLDEVPRLGRIEPRVPAELDELVTAMLHKQFSRRPPHGDAVLQALEAVDPAASPRRPTGPVWTGEKERRRIVLLLALLSDGTEEGNPTARGVPEELRERFAARGASLDRMANGALVVSRVAGATANDAIDDLARCALDLQSFSPNALMGLATGVSDPAAPLPFGDAIDRAAALVLQHGGPVAGDDPRPRIPVDAAIARLLAGRFVVDQERGRSFLRGPATPPG